jgi:hypothetical protein
MSQFKLRLQNIFKEIYPNDNKNDASSLQTNLNELSMFNNKNIPIQNNNNNDASFLNNTNSTITNTTLLNKSPSMKKIREMSTQFGIECKRDNNNNIENENVIFNDLNDKYFKIKECLSRCGNVVYDFQKKQEIISIIKTFINKKEDDKNNKKNN